MSELRTHIDIVDWLRAVAPDLIVYHVPNGGTRDKREAAKLKAMGTLAGVPDLAFVLPGGRAGFAEIKAEGSYLRPEHRAFLDAARARGALHAVVRSVEDMRETLAAWGVETREARA